MNKFIQLNYDLASKKSIFFNIDELNCITYNLSTEELKLLFKNKEKIILTEITQESYDQIITLSRNAR